MSMLLAGVAVVPLLARVLSGAGSAVGVGAALAVVLALATPRLAAAERLRPGLGPRAGP